jgi:hypothetical protein
VMSVCLVVQLFRLATATCQAQGQGQGPNPLSLAGECVRALAVLPRSDSPTVLAVLVTNHGHRYARCSAGDDKMT